jgi:4-hydroxybenzoate polyprenyltransferase
MINNLKETLNRNLCKIENSKDGLLAFSLTFFFVMFLRNFLEHFSNGSTFRLDNILHFNLSFLYLSAQITVILVFFLKEDPKKVSKVVLVFFSIILLPPIVDLIWSKGQGLTMTYYVPDIHKDILNKYLTFWGDYEGSGATIGIKIEVLIGMFSVLTYSLLKKASLLKSFFISLLVYSAIFIFGMTPFVWKFFLSLFSLSYKINDQYFSFFYSLGLIPIFSYLFYKHNTHLFLELIKDLRLERIFHYFLMFFLGVFCGHFLGENSFLWSIDLWSKMIFFPISLFFSCLFAIIINNIYDINIDKISNDKRPLITQSIEINSYKRIAFLSLFLSFFYSSLLGFQWLFFNILFTGLYFIYSSPPLRLKRIPFLSKFILSAASIIMVYSGYYSIESDLKINFNLIWPLFIALGLLLNFIDLKDIKGDSNEGIKTLPLIFGRWWGKRIIGLFFLVTYPLSFLWFKNIIPITPYFLPLFALIGLTQYCLITRDHYDEKPIFYIHLIGLSSFLAWYIV